MVSPSIPAPHLAARLTDAFSRLAIWQQAEGNPLPPQSLAELAAFGRAASSDGLALRVAVVLHLASSVVEGLEGPEFLKGHGPWPLSAARRLRLSCQIEDYLGPALSALGLLIMAGPNAFAAPGGAIMPQLIVAPAPAPWLVQALAV